MTTLLSEIKSQSIKIEENTSIYDSFHKTKVKFYWYQLSEDKTLADYMRNFRDLYHSVEYYGGDIFFNKDMIQHEMREDMKKKEQA